MSFLRKRIGGGNILRIGGGNALRVQTFTTGAVPAGIPAIPPARLRVYLAEIQCYDPTISSTRTLCHATGSGYLCGETNFATRVSGGYRMRAGGGHVMRAASLQASEFYEPTLIQPAAMSCSIPADAVGGALTGGYSELTLDNTDGSLDYLRDYYFDGYTITIKSGYDNAAYSTFVTRTIAILAGQPTFGRSTVTFRLQSRIESLNTPLQTLIYGGTNVLPNGLDGTPDDLKGKRRPLIFGRVAAFTPEVVNTSLLIYEVSTGACDDIINAYDSGAYLNRGAEYTDLAAFQAATVAAGSFAVYKAGPTYIKLGQKPFGTLALCVAEKWDYTLITAAAIVKRVLQLAGYTAADWIDADFAALDAVNAGSCGIVVEPDETVASVIARLCGAVGAWFTFNALNKFRIGRLDAPAATASITITDDDIDAPGAEGQSSAQVALRRVTMQGDINYAVQQPSALAGSVVTANRTAWWGAESRDQESYNSVVHSTRLLAKEGVYRSVQNGISTLSAEGSRRLDLFSGRRDPIQLPLTGVDDWLDALDFGMTVNLQSDRAGYSAGRHMVVVGLDPNLAKNKLDVTLWG